MQSLLDRNAIREVEENWGLYRDTGRWEQLASIYTPDATVTTTWFVGNASEFILRSKDAAKRGTQAQHFIGAVSIELNGDRAIAEARVILLLRTMLNGVEIDITCHARFYDRLVRDEGSWRICMRGGICEKDRLECVDPSASVSLDHAVLMKYPAGYRYLAYVQESAGATVTPDLPTPGSASLARLYAEGAAWLAGGVGVSACLRRNSPLVATWRPASFCLQTTSPT